MMADFAAGFIAGIFAYRADNFATQCRADCPLAELPRGGGDGCRQFIVTSGCRCNRDSVRLAGLPSTGLPDQSYQ